MLTVLLLALPTSLRWAFSTCHFLRSRLSKIFLALYCEALRDFRSFSSWPLPLNGGTTPPGYYCSCRLYYCQSFYCRDQGLAPEVIWLWGKSSKASPTFRTSGIGSAVEPSSHKGTCGIRKGAERKGLIKSVEPLYLCYSLNDLRCTRPMCKITSMCITSSFVLCSGPRLWVSSARE